MNTRHALAVLTILTSMNAFAQYHNDIAPIKNARNDAKELVKSFQLVDMKLDSGAPEYSALYNDIFLPAIKEESARLEKSLDDINQALSKDYSLIMSLKGKDQTTALKETIKIAEARLAAAATKMTGPSYHAPIKNVITLNDKFKTIVEKCLTVLCVSQVKEDFIKWIKLASKINKDLDLETTSMKKVPNLSSFTKSQLQDNSSLALSLSNHLAVSLTKEEYEDILETEKQKEAKKQEVAIAEVALDYKCSNIIGETKSTATCLHPYSLRDGAKISISTANFTSDKQRQICEAVGFTFNENEISWLINEKPFGADAFSVRSVNCTQKTADSHEKRIEQSNKFLLEDGTVVLHSPRYRFQEATLSIYASKNDNADDVCRFFGHQKAFEPSNWEREVHSSYEPRSIDIKGKKVSFQFYENIWRKITCK